MAEVEQAADVRQGVVIDEVDGLIASLRVDVLKFSPKILNSTNCLLIELTNLEGAIDRLCMSSIQHHAAGKMLEWLRGYIRHPQWDKQLCICLLGALVNYFDALECKSPVA